MIHACHGSVVLGTPALDRHPDVSGPADHLFDIAQCCRRMRQAILFAVTVNFIEGLVHAMTINRILPAVAGFPGIARQPLPRLQETTVLFDPLGGPDLRSPRRTDIDDPITVNPTAADRSVCARAAFQV